MNLNINSIRENKDINIGIICITTTQLVNVFSILGYNSLSVAHFKAIESGYLIINAHVDSTVPLSTTGFIYVNASDFINTNRKTIFISEDGVSMHVGERYWAWNSVTEENSVSNIVHEKNAQNYLNDMKFGLKFFSTKEARDNYIILNKTRLITEDKVKIKLGENFWCVDKITYNVQFRTALPHSRYEENELYFSSIDMVDNYLQTHSEKHKLKFSELDMEKYFEYMCKKHIQQGYFNIQKFKEIIRK